MISSSLAIGLAGLSFLLTVTWGTLVIRLLRYYEVAESIRVFTAAKDFTRLGTPSMGGLLVILPVIVITILLHIVGLFGIAVIGYSILLPMLAMVAFAGIGAVSDWRHLRKAIKPGMRTRDRLLVFSVLAICLAYGLHAILDVPDLYLPLVKGEISLSGWYVPVAALLILATSEAYRSTEGPDGLTGMLAVIGFGSFGAIALLQGQIYLARFCFTAVGALFGFLWFNVKPAALLLGSTGTFALGGTLGVVAMMTAQWPLLSLIALIPFIELGSVLLQRYFDWRYKNSRLFRMAPLHFHLELSGWSPTQIVQRFWLINLLFATIGITLALF